VDKLKRVAVALGQPAARVALAWVLGRPGVRAPLIGVSRVEQLHDNLRALDPKLAPCDREALGAVSARGQRMLPSLFTPGVRQQVVFGGSKVAAWTELD
jgi:aryl-alcohol dehydrogenase-like predicted oxidoreductase